MECNMKNNKNIMIRLGIIYFRNSKRDTTYVIRTVNKYIKEFSYYTPDS